MSKKPVAFATLAAHMALNRCRIVKGATFKGYAGAYPYVIFACKDFELLYSGVDSARWQRPCDADLSLRINAMRQVVLVFALLCGLPGTSTWAMAQVVGITGDRYESYAARFVCTKTNCNFSFPLFVVPSNAPGKLLVEDVSCMSLSATLAYAAFFGSTAAVGVGLGNKKVALHYTNAPYNTLGNTYAASYRAEPGMIIFQNNYPTLNFFFNPKQGTSIIDSFTWCNLSGRILP